MRLYGMPLPGKTNPDHFAGLLNYAALPQLCRIVSIAALSVNLPV
jgi:hypothetical protein